MRLHTAYKWPFWEHIIDHISKTGNVSCLKFSGKQDLTMPFCKTLIKCIFMTQFFCSIDITWKKLNQHQYRVLAKSGIYWTWRHLNLSIYYYVSGKPRDEFNFWNVHGIMTTSGLLLVSEARCEASRSLWKRPFVCMIPWTGTDQKFNLLLIFTFYYKYLNYKTY